MLPDVWNPDAQGPQRLHHFPDRNHFQSYHVAAFNYEKGDSGPNPIQLSSADAAMPMECVLQPVVGGQSWRPLQVHFLFRYLAILKIFYKTLRMEVFRVKGSAKDTFTPLLADGFCGMLPKTGSVVGGLYMIVMTNMYLIFETGHMNRSLTIAKQFNPERVPKLPKLLPHCYYTAISLALLTYPVCVYYIYSVCKQKALGLLIYVVWIIFYDLANCVIIVVTAKAAQAAHFSISFLEWFGFARIPTDCFWLSFTVTYLLLITEGRVSIRLRRISKHVPEPPRFRLGINARRGQ